ncbi:MAG: Uma2 family endonuclease [Pirellulales bacterium]|nr:Uma2 family endonuclease [Pirellulales bacterium]
MATVEHLITAEEIFQLPNLGRCELIRGELFRMAPAGSEHGGIIRNLTVFLGTFVKKRKLGKIFGAETGFYIHRNPDTVRAPDVAFVRSERLSEKLPKGFFEGAPDLAVEVLSPDDRPGYVQAEIRDWLDAGCLAVWIVDPDHETVTIYEKARDVVVFHRNDNLTGKRVLPGFSVPASEIFE